MLQTAKLCTKHVIFMNNNCLICNNTEIYKELMKKIISFICKQKPKKGQEKPHQKGLLQV